MGDTGSRRGHAFISYVREDSSEVDSLQQALEEAGVRVWRDTRDLWPGEDWRARIRDAITGDALVFIACFSLRSAAREKSYQNEELTLAIEQLRQRRPDVPWLIPVRFEECAIPDHDIGGGRTLSSIQHADLFGEQHAEALSRLVAAVLRILGRYGRNSATYAAHSIESSYSVRYATLSPSDVTPRREVRRNVSRSAVGQACYTWGRDPDAGRRGFGFVALSPSVQPDRLWLEEVTRSITSFVGSHVSREDRRSYSPIGRHVAMDKSLAYRKADVGLDGYGRSGNYLIHFVISAKSDLTLSDVIQLSPSVWMDPDKYSMDRKIELEDWSLPASELFLPADLKAPDAPRIIDALRILAKEGALEVTGWNKTDLLSLLGSAPAWLDVNARFFPQWTSRGPVAQILIEDEGRIYRKAEDHRIRPSHERLIDVRARVSNCASRGELLAVVDKMRAGYPPGAIRANRALIRTARELQVESEPGERHENLPSDSGRHRNASRLSLMLGDVLVALMLGKKIDAVAIVVGFILWAFRLPLYVPLLIIGLVLGIQVIGYLMLDPSQRRRLRQQRRR